MSVTIASFTFDYSRAGATGYLRSYNTSGGGFIDPDGVFHSAQSAGGQDYMKEVAFTVASNVATVPTFTHPATWDEAAGARASVTFLVLDSNRNKVGVLVSDFRIPTLPATTTWGALLTHNDDAATIRDTNVYTKPQTDYQIEQAALAGGPASVAALGRVKTSVAPLDATSPVGVITADPTYTARYNAALYVSFSAAVSAIGSTRAMLEVSTPLTVAASLTVPANISLSFVGLGQLTISTGQTLTIVGDVRCDTPRQIFAGAGLVRFTGNKTLSTFYVEWWGAAADGATNSTASIQACWDALSASAIDATVQFLAGVYLISGALQDVAASNSQLVLPKITSNGAMMALRLRGAAPAPTMAVGVAGTILRSTLAAGSGSVIGVRTDVVFAGTTGITYLSLHVEDLTIQTVDNPTISGIDASYVPNQRYENVKVLAGSDTTITEPTTATSYGIKTAVNSVPDVVRLVNVQVTGFYNGLRAGELTNADDVVFNFVKVAIEIPPAYHPLRFGRVVITESISAVSFVAGGAPDTAMVRFEQLDIEHDSAAVWYQFGTDVLDSGDRGYGVIVWHVILKNSGWSDVFAITSGANLRPLRQFAPNALFDLRVGAAGSPLSRVRLGNVTLVAGAATVADTNVTASTKIFLTSQIDGGTPGWLRVSARSAGVSFTITSSSGTDTSIVGYLMVEPAP